MNQVIVISDGEDDALELDYSVNSNIGVVVIDDSEDDTTLETMNDTLYRDTSSSSTLNTANSTSLQKEDVFALKPGNDSLHKYETENNVLNILPSASPNTSTECSNGIFQRLLSKVQSCVNGRKRKWQEDDKLSISPACSSKESDADSSDTCSVTGLSAANDDGTVPTTSMSTASGSAASQDHKRKKRTHESAKNKVNSREKSDLTESIRTPTEWITCPLCHEVFHADNEQVFSKHFREHLAKFCHHCRECKSHHPSIKKHLVSEPRHVFTCPFCNKGRGKKHLILKRLAGHIAGGHGPQLRVNNQYVCPVSRCDLTMPSAGDFTSHYLSEHIGLPTMERPHIYCWLCDQNEQVHTHFSWDDVSALSWHYEQEHGVVFTGEANKAFHFFKLETDVRRKSGLHTSGYNTRSSSSPLANTKTDIKAEPSGSSNCSNTQPSIPPSTLVIRRKSGLRISGSNTRLSSSSANTKKVTNAEPSDSSKGSNAQPSSSHNADCIQSSNESSSTSDHAKIARTSSNNNDRGVVVKLGIEAGSSTNIKNSPSTLISGSRPPTNKAKPSHSSDNTAQSSATSNGADNMKSSNKSCGKRMRLENAETSSSENNNAVVEGLSHTVKSGFPNGFTNKSSSKRMRSENAETSSSENNALVDDLTRTVKPGFPNGLTNKSPALMDIGNGQATAGGSGVRNPPVGDSVLELSKFSHIIFIDLDNWGKFFALPHPLPSTVFVWGFCGGNYSGKRVCSEHFRTLRNENRFLQHPKCGKSKNAADFALCVQAARLDLLLPVNIPFTVLSGDNGFDELRVQLKSSARKIHLVNPHKVQPDMLYEILWNIGDASRPIEIS